MLPEISNLTVAFRPLKASPVAKEGKFGEYEAKEYMDS
jgi:hypothetical protein